MSGTRAFGEKRREINAVVVTLPATVTVGPVNLGRPPAPPEPPCPFFTAGLTASCLLGLAGKSYHLLSASCMQSNSCHLPPPVEPSLPAPSGREGWVLPFFPESTVRLGRLGCGLREGRKWGAGQVLLTQL